jgi:hypothetical protein
MRHSRIVSAAVATALLLSPAVTAAAPAPPASAQTAPSAWMALSMLNTNGTVGLGDAAVQPGPPPENAPPPGDYNVGGIPTPVIAFWVLTVAAMVYIATRHSSGHFHFTSNSPG